GAPKYVACDFWSAFDCCCKLGTRFSRISATNSRPGHGTMACCHYDVGDLRRDAPEQSKCLAAGWAQYLSGRCSFICRLHPSAFRVVTLRHTCGMEYWSGLRFGIPA